MYGAKRLNDPNVDVDEIFHVLSNRRRRFVVHILKNRGQAVEIGSMADKIAAWENEISIGEVTGKMRKSVYTALRQTHLPKMNEYGFVNFRKDRGLIEPTNKLKNLDVYLDIVYGRDISWSKYYLGLAIVGAIILVGTQFSIWPFSVAPIGWGVAFVTAMLFSAVAHEWYNRQTRLGVEEVPPECELDRSQDST